MSQLAVLNVIGFVIKGLLLAVVGRFLFPGLVEKKEDSFCKLYDKF